MRSFLAVAAVGLVSCGLLHCNIQSNIDSIAAQIADSGIDLTVHYDMSLERFDTTTKTFEVLTPPPTERNLFWVEQAHDKLVVIGGVDTRAKLVANVDVYDPVAKTWKAGASWTNPRTANFVHVDNLVCAVAGSLELAAKRDVECYDVDADAWSTRKPVPDEVGDVNPVAFNGKIYLLGGTILGGQNLVTPHTKAFAYDPKTDAWATLPNLPSPRGLAASIPTGEKLYVVGGISAAQTGTDGPATRDMLVFDPAKTDATAWTAAPQMPNPRVIGFGVDAIGQSGELATYFGLDGKPLLDRYSASTNSWRNGTEPTEEIAPGVYTRVVYEGDIYLLVILDKIGSKGTSASGKLWKYDAAADSWSVIGQRSPNERDALFFGQAIGQSLYFAGAYTSAKITH